MLGQLAHNLPAPRTSLIGREHDIAETRDLVLNGVERLITLTGVGGSGKTRLALQVAADLYDAFPDGVWLVELASISDPLLVPETVAASLGLPEASADTILNTLVTSLQSRALLIVLDNCEHLVDACARLADILLSACPKLRIMATSREPLQIAGERQRRVLPLKVPEPGELTSPEELAHCPSVQLFVDRASAVEASFQLTPENAPAVAQICTLLDGIPLAIELAAARIRVLSAEQVVQRLDDCFRLLAGNSRSAPTRQQTLRAALDWSYDLLSEREQAAFRRLSVFAGGWSLEAAVAVYQGGGLEGAEALDLLTQLVDKSLVLVREQGGEAHYRLLEPVRQYAEQRLKADGEVEATQGRLTAFCIALAGQAEYGLHGDKQASWLRRLDHELVNIRAALRWAEERGDAETSLRITGPLFWYFWLRRHLREGQRWIDWALNQDAVVPPAVRAKGLFSASFMLGMLGEHQRGLTLGREALSLYEQLGDANGLSRTTEAMAMMTLAQGDLATSRVLAEESVVHARVSQSWFQHAHALVILGQVAFRQGDTKQAVEFHEQAIAFFRDRRDSESLNYAMTSLASLQQGGMPDIIRAAALSTIQLYWEQGDYHSLASALEYLARQKDTGHADEEVRLFAAAQILRQSLGVPLSAGEHDDVERHLAQARDRLGEAHFAAAWAEGSAMSLEQVVKSALGEPKSNAALELPAPRSRMAGPPDTLTRREREVAKLVALGYTDRQIADRLTITEGTAGIHVHHILEKLGLRSRVQVMDWALAQGLIDKQTD